MRWLFIVMRTSEWTKKNRHTHKEVRRERKREREGERESNESDCSNLAHAKKNRGGGECQVGGYLSPDLGPKTD